MSDVTGYILDSDVSGFVYDFKVSGTTKLYVDGSLALRDTSIAWLNTNKQPIGNYILDTSTGIGLYWVDGTLDVSIEGVPLSYIDGSFGFRDASINSLFNKNISQDASVVRIDASLNALGATIPTNLVWDRDLNYLILYRPAGNWSSSITGFTFTNPSTLADSPDWMGTCVKFYTAEVISSRKLIYVNTAGKAAIADADASNMMPAIGINHTRTDIASGVEAAFLVYGPYRNVSENFTIGKQVYTGLDGLPTTTIPNAATDCVQVIGIATSPDSMIFNPSPDFIVLK